MMNKALVPIFLAVLVYVSAQTNDTTTTSTETPPTSSTTLSTTLSTTSSTASPTSSSTTASPSSSSSTTELSSTTTNSTSTSTQSSSTTETPTPSTPAINTCQKMGRFPATTAKCIQDYIVCIPKWDGTFWQHNWKCAGSLVYNDKYKKCTAPRKADCLTATS